MPKGLDRDTPRTESSARKLRLVGPAEALCRELGAALEDAGIPVTSPADAAEASPGAVPVLVPDRRRPDGDAAAELARAFAEAGRKRVVLVSSAEIVEPNHRHPGHLPEDRPKVRKPTNRIARRWLELELKVAAATGPERDVRLVILRPTALPVAGDSGPWSRLLRRRVTAVPAGYDPSVQWLELADLATAVRDAALGPLPETGGGPVIWNVVPSGVEPLRAGLRRRGVRPVPVPTFLLRLLAGGSGGSGGEGDTVEYLRHSWTVSGRSLAAHRQDLGSKRAAETFVGGEHDPFGMDRAYIDRLGRTLFRFLHDRYWRIEWRGLEHVPTDGGAVLAGMHRGHQPWDGVMVLHRLARSLGRYPRFLIHPTLVKHPYIAPYMNKCGGLNACRENGDWVLERNELLAIFPEGIRGAFSYYRNSYTLKKFGRHDFVKFALRHGVPIVPFVVLGSAEIFPIYGKLHWKWWIRTSEWPCLPITPTASLVPLPSKWHVLFLEPLHVGAEYGPEAAEDPRTVRAVSDEVRRRMSLSIRHLLSRRKRVFYGSIFEDPEWQAPALSQLTENPA